MDLSQLQTEVARNRTIDDSARALISGLADQLEAAAGDPAAVQALVDELRAANDSLAAAVSENTPVVP